MIDHIPYIHLIEVYNEKYFYDVNTNGIIHISDEMYDFLKNLLSKTSITREQIGKEYSALSEECKSDIDLLMQKGFLCDKNENIIFRHPETDRIEEFYKTNLNMMTLQVTQNCNLRCKYCVYSGSYVNRTHMNKRMSVETAIAAIKFFYDHSLNSDSVTIGFYGGEPLLEYELIKQCVAYAEEIFAGKKLSFNMTSNATLFTEESVLFLAAHDFNLTISLDGPANIQNKNRIFAGSNRGTYETVMEKLDMVKEICPAFIKKISFNAVIDLKQDVSCTSEFFMSYDLVKEIGVSGNYVDVNNLKELEQDDVPPEFYANSSYEVFKVYLNSCTNLLKGYDYSLYNFHISALHNQMVERNVYNKHKSCYDCPGGQCLPGIQRLFVNVDGRMFPCERVNETSDILCIGSIQEGFNIKNAKNLLNVAKISEDECKRCWCYKMCELCCGKAENNGKLDKGKRLSFCKTSRFSIEENIKNYITLKKYGCRTL